MLCQRSQAGVWRRIIPAMYRCLLKMKHRTASEDINPLMICHHHVLHIHPSKPRSVMTNAFHSKS